MATPYLGQIEAFAFGYAPKGWAFCAGQLLPINQNQALFALLGTTFGGNGINTFALPNLQGRVGIGSGNGAGLTPRTLGTEGGEDARVGRTSPAPA
jgi:microcystin-dependent protein